MLTIPILSVEKRTVTIMFRSIKRNESGNREEDESTGRKVAIL